MASSECMGAGTYFLAQQCLPVRVLKHVALYIRYVSCLIHSSWSIQSRFVCNHWLNPNPHPHPPHKQSIDIQALYTHLIQCSKLVWQSKHSLFDVETLIKCSLLFCNGILFKRSLEHFNQIFCFQFRLKKNCC